MSKNFRVKNTLKVIYKSCRDISNPELDVDAGHLRVPRLVWKVRGPLKAQCLYPNGLRISIDFIGSFEKIYKISRIVSLRSRCNLFPICEQFYKLISITAAIFSSLNAEFENFCGLGEIDLDSSLSLPVSLTMPQSHRVLVNIP